jgi:hypothetical protein
MKKIFIFLLLTPFVAAAGEFLVPLGNGARTLSTQYEIVCAAEDCYYVVDEQAAQALVASGAADSYEENLVRYLHTNDTEFPFQWALNDNSIGWERGETLMSTVPPLRPNSAAVAAIIDTGFYPHGDLGGKNNEYNLLWRLPNGEYSAAVDNTSIDMVGHGTHVAGIIAAATDNEKGIAGTSYGRAHILPIKATVNASETFRASDIIEAIGIVLDYRAQGVPILAVNMSLGGYYASNAEFAAYKRLNDAGIIVVTSAGNDRIDLSYRAVYPAEYNLNNIITVAALDEYLELATYSNFGGTTAIAAPGSNILSTAMFLEDGLAYDVYDLRSGTSMAAPFITGTLLAGKALNPALTAAQLMNILYDSATYNSNLDGFVQNSRQIDVGEFLRQVDECRADCEVSLFFPPKEGRGYVVPSSGGDSSGIFGCSMSNGGGGWDMLW